MDKTKVEKNIAELKAWEKSYNEWLKTASIEELKDFKEKFEGFDTYKITLKLYSGF